MGKRARYVPERLSSSPFVKNKSPKKKEYKAHRKALEEAKIERLSSSPFVKNKSVKNEGLLRGPKQGTGNSEEDDYEDPAEVFCDCQPVWEEAGAHVYGEGCFFKNEKRRGTCKCFLKWALHNESCNARYRQLPDKN